ncbi:MAG: beta-ketoacyl synthase [Bacteroidia bacterium]|nr:beta-ketoacyl synthase [Bacteroidia bacterium]
MPDVFVVSDNILSPLGLTTAENFERLTKNTTGIKEHDDATISARPFYASLFDKKDGFIKKVTKHIYTKFEQLLIASVSNVLENSGIDTNDKKTILIISSTKGNISLLETETYTPALAKRIALQTSAKLVAVHFGFVNPPIVISNACISGLLAILVGKRLIQSGQYENAVIAGADVISKFVLSGFQSFQAISEEPCKPFDEARSGISLGEGAGTVILSSQKKYAGEIKVMGGSVNNDANHISGPSRTGEELAMVIRNSLHEANIPASEIDFISAHGTATLYNDEMEANAITLAGLKSVPVNSLKGYYGHTLGAAGLIESIISIHSLKENLVLPTMGFKQPGVTKPVNICSSLLYGPLQNCLKTASGFGGCNAAVVFG